MPDIVDDEEVDGLDTASDDVDWADDFDSSEINELLGFDLSSEDGDDRSGLRALINSALVTHRRLPMLDVIFDRTARNMTTNMRQLTNDNVDVILDDVSFTRFGDFIHTLSPPTVIGVIKSAELDNYMLIAVDSELVYAVVDLLLGGRRGGAVLQEDRKFTPIELALTESVIQSLCQGLDLAFDPVVSLKLSLDRLETTPKFAAIAQDASVCSLAKYSVDMEDRGGRVVLLAPHVTLDPIQKLLLQDFIGESNTTKTAWRDHLTSEVSLSELDLHAVLVEREMTIEEVAELSVGQTIPFKSINTGVADIRAGELVVGHGMVGRSGNSIALRVMQRPSSKDPSCQEESV